MTSVRDHLEIHLFGGFSVLYGGEPVPPLPSRPARLLFAWLALHAGRPQPRTTLADNLWPELPEARARRRLSHALWQVQDGLGERAPDQPYLLTPGDAVVFDASAPYWLDVEEFEARLDTVDRGEGLDGPAMRNLHRCVELYHGDLLAGSYESWVLSEQERLKQRYVTALGRLVEGCKQRGSFDEALQFARRLTHQAPLREDAHREVMRLCVLLGQPSQALEQFERCRSVLAEELGEAPSAATIELCERIAATRGTDVARRPPAEDLVSRRLVGRDDERVALVDQLERTLAGSSGMVFVEGEPGVGKSQLLVQAAEDARWRGFTVLWGACAGPEVPYAAVSEALAPELGPVRVAQLRGHVGPVWLQVAGQLLPTLDAGQGGQGGAPEPAGALDGSRGADRMREALARVLSGLAAVDPVLLVIEDAHRADEETLALLRTLGRGTGAGRLLVVVSFRDVDARSEEAVWTGLRAVDRDARPVRLGLAPLTVFETGALLREVLGTAQLPAEFAERVHREGGGNPLYVLELLRAMRDDGSLTARSTDRLESRSVPVTRGLRDLIGARLASLLPAAGDVVRLGAVLGEEFDLDTLEAAATHDGAELPTALGELTRRNVLEIAGDRCRFTHAATRRVVLDGLAEDEARTLHLAAGAALEATHPGRVEALATHFRAGGATDRALSYLRAAAERALRLHAYGSAVGHLSGAVTLAEETGTTVTERFELLALLEGALGTLGRRDEQGQVLDQLAELARPGSEQEVEALLRRATYLGHVDRFPEAVDLARAAVERAEAHVGSLHGRALTALGRILMWEGENEGAVEVLGRAIQAFEEDRSAEASETHFAIGAALLSLQRFEEAAGPLQHALELAEERDDRAGAVEALGALARLHAETDHLDMAVELYERSIRLAREIGYRHREGVGLVDLGTGRLLRGEPVLAVSAYDEALEVFGGLGNRRGVAMVQLNRAWLRHRWFGQDVGAEQDARAALNYFEEVGHRAFAGVCLETLAGVARRRGDLEEAAEELERGLALARGTGDQRVEVQLLRGQVELALRTGADEVALTVADRTVGLAEELGLTEFVATLAATRGLAALQMGDAEAAWRDAELALAHIAQSDESPRVHHHVATIAAGTGREADERHHRLVAYEQLQDALASMGEDVREAALNEVPTHRAIVQAGEALSPRTITRRMARRDAPRGRALQRQETIPVIVELGPPPSSPAERRQQLLYLLQQVDEQEAQATLEDLSAALDVSASTVRRDLRHLRAEGHDATTRGSATG